MAEEQHKKTAEIRQLVRLLDADLSGDHNIINSLRRITGVSFSMANAVCKVLDLDMQRKIGTLSEEELHRIEAAIKNPEKHSIP